ncbi:MAG: hypothetical protein QNJ94_06790 [Alphaproteobacteria bacterium]|nr:hypothetical protein [Alphaproteobacteria bacterium]
MRRCRWIIFPLLVTACTTVKDISELRPIVDPMAAEYGDCVAEVSAHYARTINNAKKIREVATSVCEGKRRAIESALFDNDANEKQAAEYMRGVRMGANETIAAAIRRARAEKAGKQ